MVAGVVLVLIQPYTFSRIAMPMCLIEASHAPNIRVPPSTNLLTMVGNFTAEQGRFHERSGLSKSDALGWIGQLAPTRVALNFPAMVTLCHNLIIRAW